jgi:outer membrane protein
LVTSQGRLTASEENYRRVIGKTPEALAPPPPLPPLPATADEAVRIALVNNPDYIAATRQAQAAGFDVRVARAGRLPTVSGTLTGAYIDQLTGGTNGLDRSGTATSVGLVGRIPLYQGGLPGARIRQSQALEGQFLELVVASERLVVSNTRSAFATYKAALEAVAAYMDVMRDRSIVELNANNVKVLDTNLEATRDRFEIGDVTRTDVAQSEARLSLGRSQLATAQGRLAGSEENYRRVIGKTPEALAPPLRLILWSPPCV